ncbi:MAG TPA: hypothetical protein VIG33_14140 [Pseudobdellovibrionaceae bacterium]|jgi:hypothetical protein
MTIAEFLCFLNTNEGVFSTIFSGIVMLATVVYAFLTHSLVKETKHMRELQTKPKIEVIAFLKEEFVNIITLRVKNIGLGPALDVCFRLEGESQTDGEKELIQDFSRSQFLMTGLRYLGPGQELQTRYTEITENYSEKIKARLMIEVTYNSSAGKSYKDKIPVYFEEFEGYGTLGTPHLYAIAQSLEKIEKNLDHLATGFKRLKTDTYSEKDRRRERQDLEEKMERYQQNNTNS